MTETDLKMVPIHVCKQPRSQGLSSQPSGVGKRETLVTSGWSVIFPELLSRLSRFPQASGEVLEQIYPYWVPPGLNLCIGHDFIVVKKTLLHALHYSK